MSLKVNAVGATNFLLVFYTGAYLSRHLQIIFFGNYAIKYKARSSLLSSTMMLPQTQVSNKHFLRELTTPVSNRVLRIEIQIDYCIRTHRHRGPAYCGTNFHLRKPHSRKAETKCRPMPSTTKCHVKEGKPDDIVTRRERYLCDSRSARGGPRLLWVTQRLGK